MGGADLGAGRARPLRARVPARLPPVRQRPGRRGPHPGDVRPGVPLAGQLLARHLRGLAAPHHDQPLPRHGPPPAADPVRRAARGHRAPARHVAQPGAGLRRHPPRPADPGGPRRALTGVPRRRRPLRHRGPDLRGDRGDPRHQARHGAQPHPPRPRRAARSPRPPGPAGAGDAMSIPESHLAQEAIAALVDGELTAGPANRAPRHLEGCLQCRMAVQAQREAKEALLESADVDLPRDLMSRLCAIPFTTDVPGSGGGTGTLTAGPGELTVTGSSGAWSVDLHPHRRRHTDEHTARWLRRGFVGTLVGLGVGVTALALNLPAAPAPQPETPVAGPTSPQQHTEVVPPVVRTVTVGTTTALLRPGGTP